MNNVEAIDVFSKLNIEKASLRKDIDTMLSLRKEVTKLQDYASSKKIDSESYLIIQNATNTMMHFHWKYYPEVKEKIKRLHFVKSEIEKFMKLQRKENSEMYAICKILLINSKCA